MTGVQTCALPICESLKPILGAMFDWGMDYKAKNDSPGNALVDELGKALH